MKFLKLTLALVFCFLLVLPENAFADSWAKKRRTCRSWRAKYKTMAKVKQCGAWVADCKRYAKTCDGATGAVSFCSRAEPDANGVLIVNTANAISNQSLQTSSANAPHEDWCAGFDQMAQLPNLSLAPIFQYKGNFERVRNSELSIGEVIFDDEKRQITIFNIEGELNLHSLDVTNDFSALVLSITSDTEKDETEEYLTDAKYYENLIWESKILLTNKRLFSYNELAKGIRNKVDEDGRVYTKISLQSITIDVPKGVDMEDISINVGSNEGNLGYGISKKFNLSKEQKGVNITTFDIPLPNIEVKFNYYPNPVINKLFTTIELPSTEEVTISLFREDGILIRNIYQEKVEGKKEVVLETDFSDVKNGIYYLKMIIGNKTYTRRIVKQ